MQKSLICKFLIKIGIAVEMKISELDRMMVNASGKILLCAYECVHW